MALRTSLIATGAVDSSGGARASQAPRKKQKYWRKKTELPVGSWLYPDGQSLCSYVSFAVPMVVPEKAKQRDHKQESSKTTCDFGYELVKRTSGNISDVSATSAPQRKRVLPPRDTI
jgi:hypothetical protein